LSRAIRGETRLAGRLALPRLYRFSKINIYNLLHFSLSGSKKIKKNLLVNFPDEKTFLVREMDELHCDEVLYA
jgi:hypothetical protein